jgi:hypothetical protein
MTALDRHPDLGTGNAGAVAYVSAQQAELVATTRRYLLELFSMLEKVNEERADELRTTEGDFRMYFEREFRGSEALKAFLDMVADESY